MKMPFSRKSRSAYIPEGVTETWSPEENTVVVHVPVDATSPDASATADRLSELVIATVGAVQAGLFGHSIPEGASGAGVRIQVDTGTTPLPPLAERGVEILREHLGQSIPLSVVTATPAPAAKPAKGKRNKARAAQAGAASAGAPATAAPAAGAAAASTDPASEADDEPQDAPHPVAPAVPVVVEPAPRPGLLPAPYVWDAEGEHLRAEIVYLGAPDDDAQTQVDVRTLVELTVASLASPATRALVPDEAPASHPVWMTVVVNADAVGPLTEQMFVDGEDQFEGTRVDFVVVTEPREVVVGMLAER